MQFGEICVSDLNLPAIIKFSEYVAAPPEDTVMRTPAMRILETRERWHNAAQQHYIFPSAYFLSRLECLDPRDRIYALLSFMDPSISISADYSKSATELFVELVDQCKEQFQEAYEVYQLARTLELNLDDNLKLPGEEWPIFVTLKYDEVVHRPRRHRGGMIDGEGVASLEQDENPLATLLPGMEDDASLAEA